MIKKQNPLRMIMQVAVVATFASASLALAHHSFTMFDTGKQVTLKGTIKQFDWTNPHTFTWIDVPNEKGEIETWGLEGMSPNYLGRRGWSKKTLQPGDKITIIINPLKDGLKGGMFLRCTLADGKEMVMFGAAAQ